MTRYLLVPENFDLNEIKQLELPNGIYATEKIKSEKEESEIHNVSEKVKTSPSSRGEYLPYSVANYTSDPVLGRKLLRFLRSNHFRTSENGMLLLDDKLYNISLSSSFLNLINEVRRNKDSTVFYKLLRQKGIDENLVPKSKQKFF